LTAKGGESGLRNLPIMTKNQATLGGVACVGEVLRGGG
jgi:hypothetical protein